MRMQVRGVRNARRSRIFRLKAKTGAKFAKRCDNGSGKRDEDVDRGEPVIQV